MSTAADRRRFPTPKRCSAGRRATRAEVRERAPPTATPAGEPNEWIATPDFVPLELVTRVADDGARAARITAALGRCAGELTR
jgi:hypothetical protein